MNSSTGFKKRSLLRPPSGILSNNRQFLRVVDISQSQPIIASNIRTQVAVIQQQINVLDKDKRIRTGQSSLEKTYVLNLKKWLRDGQTIVEKEDDDGKILKQMGMDNYQNGFRKLWKIVTNLDLIVSKMTQLQIVQFLKYDQMYQGIAQDSANGQRILQAISKGGFNPGSFYISQLALQRQIQMFQVISQLKRSNSSNHGVNSSKGFTKTKDDTTQLIDQLRSQNRKLTQVLNQIQEQQAIRSKQLQKQQQKLANKIQNIQKSQSSSSKYIGSPKEIFSDLQSKYKTQIGDLTNKIVSLNQALAESRVKCSQLEAQLKASQDLLKSGQYSNNKKPVAGTYEEALLEQMDKMRRGFERKIQKILQQSATKERQLRKKQYEYKAQNDKIKWQKGLLLKKFQTLSS